MQKFTSPSWNMTAYQPIEEIKMGDTKKWSQTFRVPGCEVPPPICLHTKGKPTEPRWAAHCFHIILSARLCLSREVAKRASRLSDLCRTFLSPSLSIKASSHYLLHLMRLSVVQLRMLNHIVEIPPSNQRSVISFSSGAMTMGIFHCFWGWAFVSPSI